MTGLLACLQGRRLDVPSDAEITDYLAAISAPAHRAGAHPYDAPKGTRSGELTATESSRP
ncbi:hypothetical protein ACIBG7_15060 [Nonomuraea sp. NPDC050328]|uniref:hypothetical protein n=1 Tax=Nonomuraea sp. NPDC050328 TaxID=3364361 RepID=UPI0037A9452B